MGQVTVCQRDDSWRAARIGKVTASVAGAVLGLGPHSQRWAWRQVTGNHTAAELRAEANPDHLHFSLLFEGQARLAYEVETGHWVDETGFWVSDDYPWLGCSPDGLIGDDGCLECKAPEHCTRRIAPHYKVQCLIQLICTRRRYCDFAQYGWRKKEIWVERVYPLSPTGERALVRRLDDWHKEHVACATLPNRKQPKRRRTLTPTLEE